MKSILDRSFKYIPSHATDLHRTFERLRQEQEKAAAKVLPLHQPRKDTQAA